MPTLLPPPAPPADVAARLVVEPEHGAVGDEAPFLVEFALAPAGVLDDLFRTHAGWVDWGACWGICEWVGYAYCGFSVGG